MKKCKTYPRLRVRGILLCLVMILSFVLSSCACSQGSEIPLSAGLKMIEGTPVFDEGVAMQTDHFTVTPGMMAYFFYTYGATVMAQMETQKAFDESKNLHGQMFNDTQSWYDVVMSETLSHISYMLICCEAAYAEGVTLSAAQREEIANAVQSFRMSAASNYSMELDAYLKALYGPQMSEGDLSLVMELEMLASSFSGVINDRLEASVTYEQAMAYAAQHGLSDTSLSRNLAFLYLPFENGSAPEDKIVSVIAAMRLSPTEQTLRAQGMGDFGVQENLTPTNSGVKQITDWLFSASRAVGDWERLDTDNATYMVLYTGNGMTYAEVEARQALYDAAYAAWYNGWVEQLQFGYNYDCLDGYDAA